MHSSKVSSALFLAVLLCFSCHEVSPIILALTPGAAIGGMVTGIIGLALGSVSLAIVLGKAEVVDEEMGYGMEGYGSYRRKRSLNVDPKELHEEKLEIEKFLDNVYQRDNTRCIEKLICNITKRSVEGIPISSDERNILTVVEKNSNHGFTYKKMMIAQKVAAAGGDCEFIFDSCPFETSNMVEFIHETSRKVTSSTKL